MPIDLQELWDCTGFEPSVNLDSAAATTLEQELVQILGDLNLADVLQIKK